MDRRPTKIKFLIYFIVAWEKNPFAYSTDEYAEWAPNSNISAKSYLYSEQFWISGYQEGSFDEEKPEFENLMQVYSTLNKRNVSVSD